MKRILFVDDERKVLDGLQRALRGQRREWEMTFVDSGQTALDAMASAPFDVIVSDMRMPGLDGATLLARVQDKYPRTVRIVLSGHSELEAALRAMRVAHQFLSKPCDSEVLLGVVRRACDLQVLLNNPSLQETVGRIDTLPAIPRVYNQLTAALVDPEVSLDDVAAIVEQDMGITAKILQLGNSCFFGAAKKVSGIRQATMVLGTSMIRDLALSIEVFRTFENGQPPAAFSIESEQSHATLSARIARHLLPDTAMSEQAFLAAMLHDIGKLILATSLPDTLEHLAEVQAGSDRPFWTVEEEVTGTSHAELGAYLLGLWGMPYPIVEAVANHHRPTRVEHESFGVLSAVHVANGLAHEVTESVVRREPTTPARIDLDYLQSLGVIDELPGWREMAAAEAGAGEEEAA